VPALQATLQHRREHILLVPSPLMTQPAMDLCSLHARHAHCYMCLVALLQAASLLGLGLLYQGSCHRLMTETVLEEMCRTSGLQPGAPGQVGVAGGGLAVGCSGCFVPGCRANPHIVAARHQWAAAGCALCNLASAAPAAGRPLHALVDTPNGWARSLGWACWVGAHY
jgi:hypothetical protein